jgi:hypothetical protein
MLNCLNLLKLNNNVYTYLKMFLKRFLLVVFTLLLSAGFLDAKDGRLGKEPNDYSYAHLGLLLSYNEQDNIGFYGSLPLPGPLYVTASRMAYGTNLRSLDDEDAEFEKTVNTLRLGVHIGIGDLLNSISVGSVSLNLQNFVDVFAEGGVKSFSFDTSFDNDQSFGSLVAGLRFGDANDWEGRIYLDLSKEVENKETLINYEPCAPDVEICLVDDLVIEFSDDTDIKAVLDITYNATKNFGLLMGFKTSQYLENEVFLGFQLQI